MSMSPVEGLQEVKAWWLVACKRSPRAESDLLLSNHLLACNKCLLLLA